MIFRPPLCTYRLNWAKRTSRTLRVSGEKTCFSLELEGQRRARTRDFRLSKQAALTTPPGPRPLACQQTREIDPMLEKCWVRVADSGPTLAQHRVDFSFVLTLFLT